MKSTIPAKVDRAQAFRMLLLQDVVIRGLGRVWPFPRWIKFLAEGETVPRMAWINAAYSTWYGVTVDEYVGRADAEIWGDEIAGHFLRADMDAIAAPETLITTREPTPKNVDSPYCASTKIAYHVDNDGITGWAIYGECRPE